MLAQALLLQAAWAQQLPLGRAGDDPLYEVNDDVLIKTRDGATLSATVVRKRGAATPTPTLLTFDIYTDPAAQVARARAAAARGYVAVIADTRGKRLSTDAIVPYEHETADSYDVIEWISRQPWSNGQVGMYGGSYSGFTAWAATKQLHPALKTIAVSAAAIPGLGLPMEHNVFLNANYAWAFYVTGNRSLDTKIYEDQDRWSRLLDTWFASGRPYRDIDAIDGRPNPSLHRWLAHPAYDGYWQAMVPYRSDFAHVDIPVLTISGYYDDAQISALEYLKEHETYNPHAIHYLVIGPYDHFGTHRSEKAAILRGYRIDPVAQFNTPELTYGWMDYVLRGGPKPALLADKINYEVMGANEWRHATSLQQMSGPRLRLYLSPLKTHGHWRLASTQPAPAQTIEQTVDLADRVTQNNAHAYPDPIIEQRLTNITERMFVSDPFQRITVLSGAFSGELDVTINKRDADLAVTVFEQLPDGRFFHLAHWLGRASFASDSTTRTLLTPGQACRIPYETTLVSRKLTKGSRLVVLLDVNKNPIAQVNYGTGKDVSNESIADAKEPLQISWHTDSFVTVPLDREETAVAKRRL